MRKKLELIAFLSIMAFAISGCNTRYQSYQRNVYTEENMTEFSLDREIIEPLTSIDVTAVYSNFEIVASDNYAVEYSYFYIDNKPTFEIKDGKLIFSDEDMNKGNYFIKQKEDNYLKIFVPATCNFETISVTKSTGICSVNGFSADTVSIENTYGDINVASSNINKLNIISSSGLVGLKNLILKDTSIENTYGNIELSGINYLEKESTDCNAAIISSSGNISVTDSAIHSMKVDNSYGELTIGESNISEIRSKMSSGNTTIECEGLDLLDIDNMYGNITVNCDGNQDDYVIDITTNYSSVTVGKAIYDKGVIIDKGGTRKLTVTTQSGEVKLSFNQ